MERDANESSREKSITRTTMDISTGDILEKMFQILDSTHRRDAGNEENLYDETSGKASCVLYNGIPVLYPESKGLHDKDDSSEDFNDLQIHKKSRYFSNVTIDSDQDNDFEDGNKDDVVMTPRSDTNKDILDSGISSKCTTITGDGKNNYLFGPLETSANTTGQSTDLLSDSEGNQDCDNKGKLSDSLSKSLDLPHNSGLSDDNVKMSKSSGVGSEASNNGTVIIRDEDEYSSGSVDGIETIVLKKAIDCANKESTESETFIKQSNEGTCNDIIIPKDSSKETEDLKRTFTITASKSIEVDGHPNVHIMNAVDSTSSSPGLLKRLTPDFNTCSSKSLSAAVEIYIEYIAELSREMLENSSHNENSDILHFSVKDYVKHLVEASDGILQVAQAMTTVDQLHSVVTKFVKNVKKLSSEILEKIDSLSDSEEVQNSIWMYVNQVVEQSEKVLKMAQESSHKKNVYNEVSMYVDDLIHQSLEAAKKETNYAENITNSSFPELDVVKIISGHANLMFVETCSSGDNIALQESLQDLTDKITEMANDIFSPSPVRSKLSSPSVDNITEAIVSQAEDILKQCMRGKESESVKSAVVNYTTQVVDATEAIIEKSQLVKDRSKIQPDVEEFIDGLNTISSDILHVPLKGDMNQTFSCAVTNIIENGTKLSKELLKKNVKATTLDFRMQQYIKNVKSMFSEILITVPATQNEIESVELAVQNFIDAIKKQVIEKEPTNGSSQHPKYLQDLENSCVENSAVVQSEQIHREEKDFSNTLLNKVQFDDDNSINPMQKENEREPDARHATNPSPGPTSTPDVSLIESLPDQELDKVKQPQQMLGVTATTERCNDNLAVPFPIKNSDAPSPSAGYTESTELAKYMTRDSKDTVDSSTATLPYVPDCESKVIEPQPSGTPKPTESIKTKRLGSYTLEAPSPALLESILADQSQVTESPNDHMNEKRIQHQPTLGSEINMDVQRKLEFSDVNSVSERGTSQVGVAITASDLKTPSKPDEKENEKEISPGTENMIYGKEKHLQKYLESLSHIHTNDERPNTREGLISSPRSPSSQLQHPVRHSYENLKGAHGVKQQKLIKQKTREKFPDAFYPVPSSKHSLNQHSQIATTLPNETKTSNRISGRKKPSMSSRGHATHERVATRKIIQSGGAYPTGDLTDRPKVRKSQGHDPRKAAGSHLAGVSKNTIPHGSTQSTYLGSSSQYGQTMSSTTTVPETPDMQTFATMSDQDILAFQMSYLESLQQQLMEQQRQQLSILLEEQQKQHLALQQEIIMQQQTFRQQLGLKSSRRSMPTMQSKERSPNLSTSHPFQSLPLQYSMPGQVPLSLQQPMMASQYPLLGQTTNPPIPVMQPHFMMPQEQPVPRQINSSRLSNDSMSLGQVAQVLNESVNFGSVKDMPCNNLVNNVRLNPVGEGDAPNLSVPQEQPLESESSPIMGPHVSFASGDNDGALYYSSPEHQSPPEPSTVIRANHQKMNYSNSGNSPVGYQQENKRNYLITNEDLPPALKLKFDKISAFAKGFLTRKLFASDKVQQLKKTIRDTAEFALSFQLESSVNLSRSSFEEKNLVDRVLAQLTSCMYEIHEIFFETSVFERMMIISQSRNHEKQLLFKSQDIHLKKPQVSQATLKAIERRRRAKVAEQALMEQLRSSGCNPLTPNASSPRREKSTDESGPIKRHYQFLVNRVNKAATHHPNVSPIKPVKDNLNQRAKAKENAKAKDINQTKSKPAVMRKISARNADSDRDQGETIKSTQPLQNSNIRRTLHSKPKTRPAGPWK